MHELSICSSIARVVEENAAGRRVTLVDLRIGKARQVIPDTLTACWEVLTETGALAGSHLRIDHVPVRVRCLGCGAESELDRPIFRCPACAQSDLEILSGEELSVVAIEVETPDEDDLRTRADSGQ